MKANTVSHIVRLISLIKASFIQQLPSQSSARHSGYKPDTAPYAMQANRNFRYAGNEIIICADLIPA